MKVHFQQKWGTTMASKFGTWWQKIKRHPFIATGIIGAILFTILAYKLGWDWTGFNSGESQTITISTSKGTTTAEVVQPAKTLWDWLGLLAILAIPVVVGIGAAWFTKKQTEQSDADKTDNQRETALQAYLDKMSELLLKEHLGELLPDGKADQKYRQQQNGNIKDELKPEYETVRNIARARTLTVLRGLDAIRKVSVFQFLYESGLADKNKRIIDLSGADLRGVNLYRTNLWGADLSGVYLIRADLFDAYLVDADLSGADLSNARLRGAHLQRADLRGANLYGTNLWGADLSGAHLNDACLGRISLRGVEQLPAADLGWTNLSRADLSGAHLSGTNLSLANLSGANLTKAFGITTEELEKQAKSLTGAIMPDGKMYHDSSGANLVGANLKEVNLSGVDLSNADLSGVDLSKTNLKDAKLEGTNLTGVVGITTEELEKQAASLTGATMPDGSKHP